MKFSDPDSYFSAIQSIVEEKIRTAYEEGQFDDLPGKGKSLDLRRDATVNPSLRVSCQVLRNAGILPPEMRLRREICDLKGLLNQIDNEEDALDLVKDINEKVLECNMMSGLTMSSEVQEVYGARVLEKLRSRKDRYRSESSNK
jgi:hypothetical protein